MNSRGTLVVVAAVCLLANLGWGRLQDSRLTHPLEGLDSFAERSSAEAEVPGVPVAAVRDAELVHLIGFGLPHVEHALPVTPDTLSAFGSCTKALTALEPVVAPPTFRRVHGAPDHTESQHQREIPSDVLESLAQVTLGETPQWILVRGGNVANPVLLFLHGGLRHVRV